MYVCVHVHKKERDLLKEKERGEERDGIVGKEGKGGDFLRRVTSQ